MLTASSAKGAIVFTKSKWFKWCYCPGRFRDSRADNDITFCSGSRSVNRLRSSAEERSIRNKFENLLSENIDKLSSCAVIQLWEVIQQNTYHERRLLHDSGFRGENIIIAVLDAGFLNVNILAPFDSLFANNQL